MKKISIWIVFICAFVVSAYTTQAAFSTPFLSNKTVILNESEEYTYEIVFQNEENSSTVMNFEVIQGKEWVEPDKFEIEVGAGQYDSKSHFVIKVPNKKLDYDKPYTIEYVISSGDKGGEGMVPLTSQVKKKFFVKVQQSEKKQKHSMANIITAMIFIMAAIVWFIKKKKKSNEKGEQEKPIDLGEM